MSYQQNVLLDVVSRLAGILGKGVNKKMLLGGLAGGVIGATTALFLAPKAGSEFREDLSHPFTSKEKAPPHRPTTRKSVSAKKGHSSLKSESIHHKKESHTHHPEKVEKKRSQRTRVKKKVSEKSAS